MFIYVWVHCSPYSGKSPEFPIEKAARDDHPSPLTNEDGMLALENMDEKLIKSMAEACNDVNRLNFYGEGAVSAPATTVEVTKEEIEKSISYTYADLGQEEIRKRTKKHKLNRVVGAP